MMAGKARLFRDDCAAERTISSPDPRGHKRIGRGVHNFDCAIWGRVREDAVLAGIFEPRHEAARIEHWHLNVG